MDLAAQEPAVAPRTGGGRWRRLGYSMGSVGSEIGITPTSVLFLFYLTEVVGLKPSLAGLAIALPKIWDVLIDPMLGGWTERFSLMVGHRAPAALISGGALAGSLFLMFSLPTGASPWQLVALTTVLLLVSSTAQTAFGVVQLTVATDMTRSPTDLTALLSLGGIIGLFFSIASSGLTPMMLKWFGETLAGYSHMAAVIAGAAGLAFLVFAASTHSVRIKALDSREEPLPIFKSIRQTAGNAGFYWLLAYLGAFGTAMAILAAFLPFANRYVLHGDQASLGLLSTLSLIGMIVGQAIAALMVKWLGSTGAIKFGNTVLGGAFIALFAASYGPIWLSWGCSLVIGVALGATGVLTRSALIELAQRVTTGGVVIPLGVYLGILVAGVKLGNSAGSFTAGQLLDLAGYVPGKAQTGTTLIWLRTGYTLIPLVFFAAGAMMLRFIKPAPSELSEASIR